MIATQAIGNREPQGLMRSMEIVIEELQAHQGIPGVIAFGKRVRLACESIQPIS